MTATEQNNCKRGEWKENGNRCTYVKGLIFFYIPQAFKVISDAQSMDKEKSLHLLNSYSEVEREIKGLDHSFRNLLYTSEGDVLFKMRSRMKRMEKRDYVVLVAGTCMSL